MLIDSHCHLHDKEFFSEEEAGRALARAREAGVEKIVCIGTSREDSLAAREFASKHENVYWTYGIHPENAGRIDSEGVLAEPIFSESGLGFSSTSYAGPPAEPPLRGEPVGVVRNIRAENPNLVKIPKKQVSATPSATIPTRLVGIGEVGLDYHYEGYEREAQIRLLEEMLQLAVDNELPVSFHVREAFSDFFPVVANFPKVRGVVHSFTDSKKVLKRILNETEFYVGVNGLATYSTLPLPPLERILLETDAPFLAPVPHRGEKNEPMYITEVAKWLAGKLEMPLEEVEGATTENTKRLFGI